MQSMFWGLAVEISRPLMSSPENSGDCTAIFCSLHAIYLFTEEMWNSSMGSFFYLYSKKKILPQKELDYMWPLISGLGWFNVQDDIYVHA